MLAMWLQFLLSGLTVGAIYGLIALGFSIIFNASRVINFAQGEFVMIGGMATASLIGVGLPLPAAAALAAVAGVGVGLCLGKFAIEPARRAPVVSLVIITIGASLTLRGLAQIVWDKNSHALPPFSGDIPIAVGSATILPQSLWVLAIGMVVVLGLTLFFGHTRLGKAMLAAAENPDAARLVGIDVKLVLALSFGLSALLGAIAGIIVAPITLTSYDVGIMLGLKGFAAAILGGLGNGVGAVLGGLLLGVVEAFGAGYLSSAYKDAIAFVIILLVLSFLPHGLFRPRAIDRV